MKKLNKKLNLVYVLQIFAVLLIFGYKGPLSETKDQVINKTSPREMIKNPAIKREWDLLPVIYIGKSW